ncbi:hypothetical protein [Pseudomonas poae]|uniref:hypothetical protein n=1 Tax=Pseudomonas poae TaxID=200451 RepID=UPI0011CE6408|nr:hypothetical protein [Pseudomonas poae]
MQVSANEYDEINGEILSQDLCEALPITWVVSIESPVRGIFSLFSNRKFYIKQLRNNLMETVTIMEIISLDDTKGTVSLQRVADPFEILPVKVSLAKDLPAFDDDFNEISEFCADSPKRLRERVLPLYRITLPLKRLESTSF